MQRVGAALVLAGGVASLAAVMTFVPALAEWGMYRHDAVLRGQVWRLVTAMWVHLNMLHWLANSLAAAGLIMLTASGIAVRRIALALLACGLLVTLALLRVPEITWYAGLSGALHGLALWAGITLATGDTSRLQRFIGVALCVGVALKLWLEQSWLSPVAYDTAWGFGVVRLAHGMGAFSGGLWWVFEQWRSTRRHRA